ncbi:MAG TPA: phage protein Gp27 family protein [Phycisphaerae bacterium]|nr:phage protein Gp27 family protein [Phycisphaerae bacterium]
MSQPQKAYQLLAAVAAKQAGLKVPALDDPGEPDDWLTAVAEKVASSKPACKIRDDLWCDLERRLRDETSYSVSSLMSWVNDLAAEHLSDEGVCVGRSSLHRSRVKILEAEKAISLRAKLAAAVIDAAGRRGEADVFKAGRILAGQLIFEALDALPVDALDQLKPHQFIGLIDVLGRLSKQHVETDILAAKLTEVRRKFDEQIAAAQAKSTDGKLTAEMIQEAKESIFGQVA